jgi:E3 ubiquitin-protein ligase SHPRH
MGELTEIDTSGACVEVGAEGGAEAGAESARAKAARKAPEALAAAEAAALAEAAEAAEAAAGVPSYSAAFTLGECDLMAPPAGVRPRVLRYPSLPATLLAHLQAATLLPPGSSPRDLASAGTSLGAKVSRLLADLEALGLDERGVPRKAVVFSQHKAVIRHIAFALRLAGVGHVSICQGDKTQSQDESVVTWSSSAACKVFLLHAGAAAAGLTLVAARHIFLMEPFLTPGQELQALNRCHRIGQTQQVECVAYYSERTVEERLLALRREGARDRGTSTANAHHERDQEDGSLAVLSGTDAAASGNAAAAATNGFLLEELRFIFGLRDVQEGREGLQEEDDEAENDEAHNDEAHSDEAHNDDSSSAYSFGSSFDGPGPSNAYSEHSYGSEVNEDLMAEIAAMEEDER